MNRYTNNFLVSLISNRFVLDKIINSSEKIFTHPLRNILDSNQSPTLK